MHCDKYHDCDAWREADEKEDGERDGEAVPYVAEETLVVVLVDCVVERKSAYDGMNEVL
jgi:hypothetical protein